MGYLVQISIDFDVFTSSLHQNLEIVAKLKSNNKIVFLGSIGILTAKPSYFKFLFSARSPSNLQELPSFPSASQSVPRPHECVAETRSRGRMRGAGRQRQKILPGLFLYGSPGYQGIDNMHMRNQEITADSDYNSQDVNSKFNFKIAK